MKQFCSSCSSKISVGRKYYMALSGLFLISFLIAHLSGNILLFKCDNGVAFNEYAHFMSSNIIIRIAEVVLSIVFLTHIVLAIKITFKNRMARPVQYKINTNQSSWVSRNMGLTGSVILFFLVIHLKNFFVESRIYGNENMYELVQQVFSDPIYVIIYLISLLTLGLHLSHAFQSLFKSFGLYHIKYNCTIRMIGFTLAVVIPVGFASMPVFFYCIK